jgi:hypothetical protein
VRNFERLKLKLARRVHFGASLLQKVKGSREWDALPPPTLVNKILGPWCVVRASLFNTNPNFSHY